MPELTDIATAKKPRPPEVDRFLQAFSVAGGKQEKVVMKQLRSYLGISRLIQTFRGQRPHSTKRKRSKKDSSATSRTAEPLMAWGCGELEFSVREILDCGYSELPLPPGQSPCCSASIFSSRMRW